MPNLLDAYFGVHGVPDVLCVSSFDATDFFITGRCILPASTAIGYAKI